MQSIISAKSFRNTQKVAHDDWELRVLFEGESEKSINFFPFVDSQIGLMEWKRKNTKLNYKVTV